MRRRLWPTAVTVLVLTGIVVRWLMYNGRSGTLDSDEAVVGLMADAIRDGHWQAFYWGQHYAGTAETALVAISTAVLGSTTLAVKIVPALLSAVASVLTWRVGRRFLDDRLAQAAALLTWVASGAYVWWSLKERGFYWVTIVAGLAAVLAAQRIVAGGRPPWLDAVVFGLAAGVGFWSSPNIAYFVAPAGVWVVARRHPPLKWLAAAVPVAVVGALPWIWHNVGHRWASLESPPQPEHLGYVDGIGRLLWRTLPMMLNLRYPVGGTWLHPVAAALYLALAVAFVAALVLRRDRPVLLLALLGAFPFIYALFPGRWLVGEGRYAVFVVPLLALGLAWLLRRPYVVAAVAAAGAVMSLVVVNPIGPEPPRHPGADVAALRAAGVDRAWSDYRTGYRLSFLSEGHLRISPIDNSRHDGRYRAARFDLTPAFLFLRGDPRAAALRRALPLPSRLVRTPHLVAVLVDGAIDPRVLPPTVLPLG